MLTSGRPRKEILLRYERPLRMRLGIGGGVTRARACCRSLRLSQAQKVSNAAANVAKTPLRSATKIQGCTRTKNFANDHRRKQNPLGCHANRQSRRNPCFNPRRSPSDCAESKNERQRK